MKNTNAIKKTYVSIILDQSGSMSNIWDDTIGSFNTQVDAIKTAANGTETFVTLTLFNSLVDIKYFAEPIDKLVELSRLTYRPDGGTAMYDAIGFTIDRMQKELSDIDSPNVSVLFLIITDGQENSSRTVSASMIGDMIKSLNKTNRWTFSVLGANIDLAGLSGTLNIATSNMASFATDKAGVIRAASVTTDSYARYFTSRNLVDNVEEAAIGTGFYNSTGESIIDTSIDMSVKK